MSLPYFQLKNTDTGVVHKVALSQDMWEDFTNQHEIDAVNSLTDGGLIKANTFIKIDGEMPRIILKNVVINNSFRVWLNSVVPFTTIIEITCFKSGYTREAKYKAKLKMMPKLGANDSVEDVEFIKEGVYKN